MGALLRQEIEALLWGNNQSAPTLPQAPFRLRLQTSIVPEASPGSGTPTFTRATTAYQTDFEGKLNAVLSGEARFQGSRRVVNQAVRSDVLTAAAGWSVSSATSVIGASDPDGGTSAYTMTATAGNGQVFRSFSLPAGQTQVNSGWIRRVSGTGNVGLIDPSGTMQVITVTASWQRLSLSPISSGGTGYVGFQIAISGDVIAIYHPQAEITTGQTNTNPAEYVPNLATANADSNAIGVRYFSTLNGNTVASNVVTEATGAPINSSQAACAGGVTAKVVDANGPLGYLAEGQRQNVILQPESLATTWTISNAADMNAVADNTYVAPNGTTTMSKLQPKATTAVHSLNQAYTFTAAVHTQAFYLRYVPATPQRWVALVLNDGTTTWAASFDLLNGLAGAVSNATSTIAATALANVWLVTVTKSAAAAAAAGTVKISLNATDTATLESAARAGTETLGAWGAQLEAASFASSYIPTTTVAVTRNADVLTYPSAGNISGSAGTIYVEQTRMGDVATTNAYPAVGINSAVNMQFGRFQTTTTLGFYDGVNNPTLLTVGARSLNTVYKDMTAWSGTTVIGAEGGTAGTAQTFGAFNIGSAIAIGNYDNGLGAIAGTIRNVRIWQQQNADQRMIELTKP